MNDERTRLAKLIEAGASAFDEPTVRYVEALLARAEGPVEERLVARVRARLDRLEAAMAAAREEAAKLVTELEGLDGESAAQVRGLVSSGDFREASRLGRRLRNSHDPEASARLLSRIETIEKRAERRGVRFSAELRERCAALRAAAPLGSSGIRAGRQLATELSFALLDGILHRSRGTSIGLRLARPMEELEQVGPYNPRAVARRALEKMGALSPSYLQAWLSLLDDASALDRLLPQPQPRKRK